MGVYRPNKTGIPKLAVSRKLSRHMVDVIGRYWAEQLRSLAPHESGEYSASITVEKVTATVDRLARVGVRIAANVEYAAILEVGSQDILVPPRPLTKLLDRIEDADPGQKKKHGV